MRSAPALGGRHWTTVRWLRRAGFTLVLAGLLWPVAALGSCNITFGGGGQYGNLNLNVPYHEQGNFLLCGPTSVLMWREYDRLSYYHPQELGTLMGCPWATTGCSLNQLTSGTRFYTSSGWDAFIDDYGGVGHPDALLASYFARQITSLVRGVPVIALINGATHAVVVRAGNYSTASDGLRRWDYVYVHDPFLGPDRRHSAGEWAGTNIFQVISSWATFNWEGNLDAYGPVHLLGSVDWPPPGGAWPPVY